MMKASILSQSLYYMTHYQVLLAVGDEIEDFPCEFLWRDGDCCRGIHELGIFDLVVADLDLI